jgi:hypothetical protein
VRASVEGQSASQTFDLAIVNFISTEGDEETEEEKKEV